jgi:outer membrane protein
MINKLFIAVGLITQIITIKALDLYTAYQKALVYNADYIKALAQSKAGVEQQNIAAAALYPQIFANLTLSENYFNQSNGSAFYHQQNYGMQLNQVVFDYAKFSAYTKGKFAAQIADLQVVNARQNLMLTVAQAYFDLLYAEDTLLATQMTKKAFANQLIQAQTAFKVGSVTIADVNDAQAAYDAGAAQELQDLNNLIYKRNLFHNLTGENSEQVQPLAEQIQLLYPQPASAESWAQLAQAFNLNLLVASKQIDMAQQDLKIAGAGHLPTLNLQAVYRYQSTNGVDAINISGQQNQELMVVPGSPLSSYALGAVALQLSVPVFSGGGITAQVRQAQALYESAQQQSLSMNRNIDQNIRNAFWQVYNGVSLIQAQQTALISMKTKLNSDQLGYQLGVRNSINLLSAQKDYYKTFQTYQFSRYQYLYSQVYLHFLSGQINDKFMQQINANIRH